MKALIRAIHSTAATCVAAVGATAPWYTSDGLVTSSPQIDALVWTNRGTFSAINRNVYETQNTVRFVNNGDLRAYPGFRFETISETGERTPALEFINNRILSSVTATSSLGISDFDADDPSHPVYGGYISINAKTILNRGQISGAYAGDIRLKGEDVDLQRGGIGNVALQYTGYIGSNSKRHAESLLLGGVRSINSFLDFTDTDYLPEIGVQDRWWNVGDMRVDYNGEFGSVVGVIDTPYGPSPAASVQTPPFVYQPEFPQPNTTYRTSLPRLPDLSLFRVFVYRSNLDPDLPPNSTNQVIEVAFVKVPDTNVFVDVSWRRGPNAPDIPHHTAVIRLSTFGASSVTREGETNSLIIYDTYASDPSTQLLSNLQYPGRFQPTNIVMVRGYNMDVTKPILPLVSNAVFTPTLFANWVDDTAGFPEPGITMTNGSLIGATTNGYATWAGSVDSLPSRTPATNFINGEGFSQFFFGSQFGSSPLPLQGTFMTNFAGRVAIEAKNLNLNRTRLQARGTLSIKADNLVDSKNVALDAPIISLDLNSTNALVIENMISGKVARLGGDVAVLSLSFSNFWEQTVTNAPDPADPNATGTESTTNYVVFYHVTVVDTTFQGIQDQYLDQLFLRSKESRMVDDAFVGRDFRIDSEKITIDGILYASGINDLTKAYLPNVTNLVVGPNGALGVSGLATIGMDRAGAIAKIENYGTNYGIVASSINLEAGEFVSAGRIGASGGQATVLSDSMTSTDKSIISSTFDLTVKGNKVQIGGVLYSAVGGVEIGATDSLTDGGVPTVISSSYGLSILKKPTTSNLNATKVETAVPEFQEAVHVWAGEDLGPGAAGFANNLAIGTLSLDAGTLGTITFKGAGSKNALYCGRLEITDELLAALEDSLNIEPSITIYYASTNPNIAPEVLDGFITLGGGKLVYAPAGGTAGGSMVEARLGDGRKVMVLASLKNSTVIDSDNDGVVNANDATPFDAVVVSGVELIQDRSAVRISWKASGGSKYEIQAGSVGGAWQTVGNASNSAKVSATLSFEDALSAQAAARIYRVLITP